TMANVFPRRICTFYPCLVVVSLRLLFLVPTGVPVRSGDATFPKAMDNVTVRQGESATLR
uniref:Uncharacterized protein n=1 Tax=Castor canadensis TaxID=51338 RepID=A0A8C0WS03_CASCN